MSFFRPIYVFFNQIECFIWWTFGVYFLIQLFRQRHRPAPVLIDGLLVVGFFFFGLSDYVEAGEEHGLPWWLWLWKISLGAVLFGLLVAHDYQLRRRLPKIWHIVAASLILGLALYQAL